VSDIKTVASKQTAMQKITLLLLLLFSFSLTAQEEEKQKNWELRGYIKDLQSLSVIGLAGPTGEITKISSQDNLLHNRLNFRWFPDENFTLKLELRNRFFWGDQVRFSNAEDYEMQLAAGNDYFDLDAAAVGKAGIAAHTIIDRFYGEYVKGNWEVRLGRQRINWGINTVWNPNDIFNAYSFTDFDYEERPGSDALRVRYYTGYAGSIEVAAKVFDKWEESTVGLLWKFNKWNYDFQVLAGVATGDYALGGGWAGNIKNVGFKGEFTYFIPFENNEKESFTATLGADYSFGNSLYLNTGFLFNSNGATAGDITQLFSFDLSAKNLYPYKYATFFSASYPFSPLLNGGLALIYSPSEAQALFINPTLTYSIKENWDVDFVGQLVFNDEGELGYRSPVQALFLRFKFSF